MGMRRLTAVLVLGLIGCAGLGKNQDLVTGGAPLDQWCPEGLTLTANNGNPEPGTTPRFLYVGCELEPDLAHGPTMVWRTDAKQMIALMFMDHGKLDGPAVFWCENGAVWQQHTYKDGEPLGPAYLWDCETREQRIFETTAER